MYHVRRGAMLDKLYDQDWPERVHVPPKEIRKRSLHYSCLRLRNEKQVEGTRRFGHNLLGRKRVHVFVILQHRQHRAAVQTTIGGGHASWERSCQHRLQDHESSSVTLQSRPCGPICCTDQPHSRGCLSSLSLFINLLLDLSKSGEHCVFLYVSGLGFPWIHNQPTLKAA